MNDAEIVLQIKELCKARRYGEAIELTDKISSPGGALRAHLLCLEHEVCINKGASTETAPREPAMDDMSDAEKMALAQYCKRVGWGEVRLNAEDTAECYLIRDAIAKLQQALADEGFSPR